MADLHVKVSSAWKALKKPGGAYIKTSGAWKQVDKIYVKVSGAWKMAWQNAVVTLSGSSANGISNLGSGFRWNSDGTVDRTISGGSPWTQNNASTDWIIPNDAASGDYSIRFTENTSNGFWQYLSGGALVDGTTWHSLSTTRTIYGNSTSGLNEGTCELQVAISDDGGSTILDTGQYNMSDEDLI